jgi:uncharacterized protein YecT (DUF1311 family)
MKRKQFRMGLCIGAIVWLISMPSAPAEPNVDLKESALPLPAGMGGLWQVIKVNNDAGATHTPVYQQDDPRLVGRFFEIRSDEITSNMPEAERCTGPVVKQGDIALARLIELSMSGRGDEPATPKPKDFGLPLGDNVQVKPLRFFCKEGLLAATIGRHHGIRGAWVIALPDDTIGMSWYGDTVLTLHRAQKNRSPRASFDCKKATLASEKAICGSVYLSAYDLSVARSYKYMAAHLKETQNPDDLTKLQTEQKAWLSSRNACGSDEVCLQTSMKTRLERLAEYENPEQLNR